MERRKINNTEGKEDHGETKAPLLEASKIKENTFTKTQQNPVYSRVVSALDSAERSLFQLTHLLSLERGIFLKESNLLAELSNEVSFSELQDFAGNNSGVMQVQKPFRTIVISTPFQKNSSLSRTIESRTTPTPQSNFKNVAQPRTFASTAKSTTFVSPLNFITLSTNSLAPICKREQQSRARANATTTTPGRMANNQRFVTNQSNISKDRSNVYARNKENDDDVTYLYTVDSSSASRVVAEIDLSRESESANNPQPGKRIAAEIKPTVSKGQKRKSVDKDVGSRKRNNRDAELQCSICHIHLDSLTKNGKNMLLGSCGHLFCQPCTQQVREIFCYCGKRVDVLRKLFL